MWIPWWYMRVRILLTLAANTLMKGIESSLPIEMATCECATSLSCLSSSALVLSFARWYCLRFAGSCESMRCCGYKTSALVEANVLILR